MSENDGDLSGQIPDDVAPPADSPDKQRRCRECGALADRLAVHCPECKADLPMFGHSRRSSRGRRYVYGKRKTQLSQEAIWLIVVIIVGLLIVFGVQVIAFMRSKKLMMVPVAPRQMIARTLERRPAEPPTLSAATVQLADERLAARVRGFQPRQDRVSHVAVGAESPPHWVMEPLPARRDQQLKRPMT